MTTQLLYSDNRQINPLDRLGDISLEEFFTDYWQKKPLLIPQAFPDFDSPISADELAGFALEEDVESRLIVESTTRDSWSVTHGPLDESVFEDLPEELWTLLIQNADTLNPEVRHLLNKFRFLPNWRLDDVMISYACDKGGVGPHFDYYDVFLLQAEGKRRWRTGQQCDATSALIPNQAMKVLQGFDTTNDWVVEPGDLLYVPAKMAHWGEAIGESITYSIGFRAPSDSEFLLEFAQNAASQLQEHKRFQDNSNNLTKRTQSKSLGYQGLIDTSTISALREKVESLLNNDALLSQALGEYATQLKHNIAVDDLDLEYVEKKDIGRIEFALNPHCRSAYAITDKSSSNATLYINGIDHYCSEKLAQALCSYEYFKAQNLSKQDAELLNVLAENSGLIKAP